MIRVRVCNAHPRHKVDGAVMRAAVRRVLRNEKQTNAECTVVFINDRRMTALNGQYLGHWYATDVLSFVLSDAGAKELSGEIYVNIDQGRRQAREYGVSIRNELLRLMIHGVLHLVGYRDDTVRHKMKMTALEDRYLGL